MSKMAKIVKQNSKIFKKVTIVKKLSKLSKKNSKLSNNEKTKNFPNCSKFSKLFKIFQIVQNFPKNVKQELSKNVKNVKISTKKSQVMSPHHSDQMFLRSQVSGDTLCMSKVKEPSVTVSDSLTQCVIE